MAQKSKKFVDLDNARQEDQAAVMQKIASAKHCPFCKKNLNKYHQQPIIRETDFWYLTPNQWPYKNTKHHFLAIYKEHITNLTGLDPKAGGDLLSLFSWVEKKYNLPGGGLIMRFGSTDYSAGSVNHIHAQLIVPDITNPNYEPVWVPLGKYPDKL